MSHDVMDKKDVVDIAPAQSRVHQEIAGMADKALVTREPYGKPGIFTFVLFMKCSEHVCQT
jgi:hypothetical protein